MIMIMINCNTTLVYFCITLVAMATLFAPLKILLAYLNSPLKSVHFGLFWLKCCSNCNSLCSVENSDSIFVSADTEKATVYAKSVSTCVASPALSAFTVCQLNCNIGGLAKTKTTLFDSVQPLYSARTSLAAPVPDSEHTTLSLTRVYITRSSSLYLVHGPTE